MAAIYQWFEGVIEYQIWTTTPYPVEVVDLVSFSCQLGDGCSLTPIPTEYLDTTASLVSMELRQILKVHSADNESLDTTASLVSMELRQILKVYNADNESLDTTASIISMDLDLKLVTGDTPDEMLVFACKLDTALCSMTAV